MSGMSSELRGMLQTWPTCDASASNAQRCSLPQDDHSRFRLSDRRIILITNMATGYEHECSCCEYMPIAVSWAALNVSKVDMQM